MKYELCYLVGESKEPELARIKEEVSAIISNEGGKWFELQVEEKRKMAYKVEKEVRGIYVAQQFEIVKDEEVEDKEIMNPLDSINKKLNLYNDILRFIVVKAEDLPELKVREIKEISRKDSKKPVYVKKSEPIKEKPAAPKAPEKEEVKSEKVDDKEEKPAEKSVPVEKEEDKDKSIDEKIDEILNI